MEEEFEAHFLVEDPHVGYNEAKDFTSLVCWKKAREVKLFFYNEVIPKLPAEEKYNLISQMRRSSISITENIAEGYGRYNYQEGIQFFRISRASLYELKDDIISCLDLKYISSDLYEKGINLIESAKITLNGYIRYIKELQLKSKAK